MSDTWTVGHCSACGVRMMSEYRWKAYGPKEGWAYHEGRGLCARHYARYERYGDPLAPAPERKPSAPKVVACDRCGHDMCAQRARRKDPELAARTVRTGGRGLCQRCYDRATRAGDLPSRATRPHEETVEEWQFLRENYGSGLTTATAAARLGMSTRALELALERANTRSAA